MSGRARPARPLRRPELSQHFLRAAAAARIVQALPMLPADLVIEIGPGRGALTRPLARRARQLIAVELDGHLANKLRHGMTGPVTVVHGDFLTFSLPEQPYTVVGNVPYRITTDIVRKLVEASTPPVEAALIVQRELGQRLCGRPFTRESLWSLRLKPRWHVEVMTRLGRHDFDPPPAVESVLLRLASRGRPLLSAAEQTLYDSLIQAAFAHGGGLDRVLRPWLSKLQLRRLAAELRFSPGDPGSALAFEQWLGLLRFVQQQGGAVT